MKAGAGASALYVGSVAHQRLQPRRHRLRYGVYYLLIDLDELPRLHQRLRWFSANAFNLCSWHERDHGDGTPGGLRAYVERQLQAAGLPAGGAIQLLTMPRILGYAFNPLTVYFCRDAAGRLQAILYEVNNTFGERHSYLLPVSPSAPASPDGAVRQTCAKNFHVSPFLGLDMHYDFTVSPPGPDSPDLALHIAARAAQGALLTADLRAERRPLTDATLLRAFWSHPLLTVKVVAAIHWEALQLLAKRVGFHPKPAPPAQAVSMPARVPTPPASTASPPPGH